MTGLFVQRLSYPVSAAGLAIFRMVFGLAALWEVSRSFSLDRIERYFVEPRLLFPYYGFAWLGRLAAEPMRWLHYALMVAAALVAIGLFYRLACWFFALGFCYTFVIDQANYQNHLYLLCLLAFVLGCVDAHRAWSIDALIRRPGTRSVAVWQHALVVFQIAVVYFYGGINKLEPTWLSGVPMAVQLGGILETWGARQLAFEPAVARSFALAGVLIDLAAVPGLLWSKSRLPMFCILCAFHLSNAHLFSIGVFPWFMLAATTIFFPPDWPHRILGRAPAPASEQVPRPRAWVPVMLIAYCGLQLLLPARRVLISGSPTWTYDAAYFSWTMKLHTRIGAARLFVGMPDGREREINLLAFITEKQLRHLVYTPEMIYQFTRFARNRYPSSEGYRLRWETQLALDGRPAQPYVVADADSILRSPVTPFAPAAFVRPMENDGLPSFSELERRRF